MSPLPTADAVQQTRARHFSCSLDIPPDMALVDCNSLNAIYCIIVEMENASAYSTRVFGRTCVAFWLEANLSWYVCYLFA